jgi:hypothetical protein
LAGPPPEHWKSLSGPSNWYRLSHPPNWTVSEGQFSLILHPPESEASLLLNTAWAPAAQDEGKLPAQLSAPFPNARNLRTISDDGLPDLVQCLEGEASLNPPPTGWRKAFSRQDWRAWRMWVFRRGPLMVVATLIRGKADDPELISLARMVLQTIELTDDPADPPDVFADRVLALAKRKFPLLECRRTEDFQLQVGESTVNLFNFYRSYVKSPERFEEIMLPALTTVVQVQEWGDAQTKPLLDDVRDRIMPMLYPETVWQSKFPNFVGTPWVAGLAVLYVVDEAHAYWYVRNDLLEDWKLSGEELHDLSLTNLARYFEEHPMELAAAGSEETGPSMLMPSRSDSYNAARMVSEAFTSKLREVVGGDVAVGLPGRDFFVAVSVKASEVLQHVRQKVVEDYGQMDHPLTDRLLLLTADGVSEYFEGEVRDEGGGMREEG